MPPSQVSSLPARGRDGYTSEMENAKADRSLNNNNNVILFIIGTKFTGYE